MNKTENKQFTISSKFVLNVLNVLNVLKILKVMNLWNHDRFYCFEDKKKLDGPDGSKKYRFFYGPSPIHLNVFCETEYRERYKYTIKAYNFLQFM